ncbi:MAG TPA: hypothetical protein PKJ68_04595 [Candidatus Woesebacteria bacterium]|nr:hypothetical protein [Candidatus Woesebacteria bacterium]
MATQPAYTPYPVPTPWINQPSAYNYNASNQIKSSGSPQGFVVNPYSGPQYASPSDVLGASSSKPYVQQIPSPTPAPQQQSQSSGGGGGGSAPSGPRQITEQDALNMGLDWNNLPGGYSRATPDRGAMENQMRNEISGAYDAYFRQLDDMVGGLGNQQSNYNQQIENSYGQNLSDLTGQKNMSMGELGSQRQKNQEQQVKSLRDISDNIRNLFRTGNVMLGTRGAGDSSAANQYAYAVTKVGSKERGNVMDQTRSIENDISGREAKLNEVYMMEKSRLGTERQNQILNIANQFEQARQNLMQAKAQGQLEKGVSLNNLSRELLNQATQRMMQIDADVRNRANMLDQWALNNSTNIAQLRQNMSAIGGYKAPNVQANAIMGTPTFDAQNNMTTSLRPATGYSTGATNAEEQQPSSLFNLGSYLRR